MSRRRPSSGQRVNETTEMWREHRQHVQKQKWATQAKNAKTLRESGIPFQEKNDGTVFILRGAGLNVDYWPSTELWMKPGNPRRWHGDAKAFLKWLNAGGKT